MKTQTRRPNFLPEVIAYKWWWREQGKNLYFFNRIILGHFDANKDLHLPLCKFAQWTKLQGLTEKLILIPRGHLKTSLVTIGRPLHKIAYWNRKKDLRILIANGRFSNAQEFLSKIQMHIQKNQLYRALYGENLPSNFQSADITWNTEQCRWTIGTKEIKIDIASPKQGLASRHYDLIIADDLINEENYKSEAEMERIRQWFKLFYNLIEPDGEIIVIGTRWSDKDLYAMILDDPGYKSYKKFIRAVWKKDKEGRWIVNEEGERIPEFPEKFSREYIEFIRKKLGPVLFASQMLNDPVDESIAFFKRSWLRYYEEAPPGLNLFLVVEPARTVTQRADYTAFVLVGVDSNRNIYVLQAEQKKLTYKEIVDEIFRYWQTYDLKAVGMEYDNYEMLFYYFKDERKKRNIPVVMRKLKTRGKSKEERISRLQPLFEDGKILLKPNMDALIEQITRFPKARHDDLIDALAYVLDMAYPPEEQKKSKKFSFFTKVAKDNLQRAIKRNQLDSVLLKLYPFNGGR